jgi:DNA ligase-1
MTGVMLAKSWSPAIDPTGWLWSEKMDGVRAVWDGTRFLSRSGHTYSAPAWFSEGLGREALDGEIYAGRGAFQFCVSVARRNIPTDDWRSLRFCVFDACSAEARSLSFEERLERARAACKGCAYASVVEHAVVGAGGAAEVQATLEAIEGLGGEGLMLRQPGSAYVSGRSSALLKVKSFADHDARVTGYEPGKGKHTGRVGALICSPVGGCGPAFRVGTGLSDAEREAPPPVGSVVSYKCQEFTKAGVPRFPVYLRRRPDLAVG